eukprot:TRINITY_DN6578_c0_g1_i2.p1 TRINITY_DN6578_c0_g1~~TRINITY_DN6578_c0_g1_i2.p1  ORF type:complete len:342 (-),score=89.06 TRINITY_DN6578_c0_g1_i2:317-1342(-)
MAPVPFLLISVVLCVLALSEPCTARRSSAATSTIASGKTVDSPSSTSSSSSSSSRHEHIVARTHTEHNHGVLVDDVNDTPASYHDCYSSANHCFDFLIFVQRWPPTVCQASPGYCAVDPPPQFFSIHGLWPNYWNGSYPAYCDTRAFDTAALGNLTYEMNDQWLALDDTNSTGFWAHEWGKHGTCCLHQQRLSSFYDFFNYTVYLHNTYNVTETLQEYHIYPSNHSSITVTLVYNTIYSKYGVYPSLRCQNRTDPYVNMNIDDGDGGGGDDGGGGGRGGDGGGVGDDGIDFFEGDQQQILEEISLCFDRDLELINCPKSMAPPPGSYIYQCDDHKPLYYPA